MINNRFQRDWDSIVIQVIDLITNTRKTYKEIAKELSIGTATISRIREKYNVVRIVDRPKRMVVCKNCGNEFHLRFKSKIRLNRGKYCSRECYNNWQLSLANRGPNHPNWKHGQDSEMDRKSLSWKQWRESIYKRDNYTCQFCGIKGKKLHPHHILPRRDFPDIIYDVTNGITLCDHCHGLTINREYQYVERCNEAMRSYQPYFR